MSERQRRFLFYLLTLTRTQLKADKTVEAEKRAEDAHKQAKRTSELRAIGRKIRKQSGTVDQYQPQPTRRGGRFVGIKVEYYL